MSRILTRLDDAWTLGPWGLDVVAAFMVPAFVGILVGGTLTAFSGFIVGALIAWRITKLKASKHPGFLLHWMRWHLPQFGALNAYRTLPPTNVREMLG